METPKQILKKKYLLIEDDKTVEAHTHLVIEAMEEYAKLKSIEFAKLIIDNNVKLKLALSHIYDNGLKA